MDNKTILELAQKNKARGKENEQKVCNNSNSITIIVALVVGVILLGLEYFFKHNFNTSLIVLLAVVIGIHNLSEGLQTKKASLIIVGSVHLLIAMIVLFLFIV